MAQTKSFVVRLYFNEEVPQSNAVEYLRKALTNYNDLSVKTSGKDYFGCTLAQYKFAELLNDDLVEPTTLEEFEERARVAIKFLNGECKRGAVWDSRGHVIYDHWVTIRTGAN